MEKEDSRMESNEEEQNIDENVEAEASGDEESMNTG